MKTVFCLSHTFVIKTTGVAGVWLSFVTIFHDNGDVHYYYRLTFLRIIMMVGANGHNVLNKCLFFVTSP